MTGEATTVDNAITSVKRARANYCALLSLCVVGLYFCAFVRKGHIQRVSDLEHVLVW